MELNENGESEQPSSSSDAGQSLALRKILKEEFEPMVIKIIRRVMKPMVIDTVQQVMEPVAEDLFRRVVKEEMQAVEKKVLAGGSRNDVPKETILHLMFLDEVSGLVQTCQELKGIKGDPLEVALFDAKGRIVNCGPESSAKVEILLIDNSGNDDENNMTHENFERRIIKAGDKKKPYLAGSAYIYLERGVGKLIGLKLGHGKDWINFCYCRLGVRLAQNFRGIIVQETWTEPFKVIDKRSKQYDKLYPPFPSSDVWRLEKISRTGDPCDRLNKKNIKTVQDFMFWHHVNPEELQQEILKAGDIMWKAIVAHARTCTIDEKKMYSHKSPTEPQMSVIYDAVGKLKGVIDQSHFVPIDNLSDDKKDHAHKLLSSVLDKSAFDKRYNTPFNDEDFHLQQHASTNCSIQQCSNGNDFTLSENINVYQTTGIGCSSQSIIPNNISDSGPSNSLGSRDTGELYNPPSGLFTDPENIDRDPPTNPDNEDVQENENHCFPTSTALGKQKADAQESLAPFDEMSFLHHTSQLWTSIGPIGAYVDGLGGGSAEMVGESSSRRSNASFHSVNSTMQSFGETGGYWCGGNDDDQWGIGNELPPGPPSPNPMLHYVDDTYSHNIETCDQRNESRADEGSAAAAHTSSENPPNKLKRIWLSFKEKMSLDVTCTHKKHKL